MKKVLIGVILLSLLAGCGGNVKSYTKEQKEALFERIYEKNDMNAKKEYEQIIKQLEEKSLKGNQKASKELEEWKTLSRFYW